MGKEDQDGGSAVQSWTVVAEIGVVNFGGSPTAVLADFLQTAREREEGE